MGEFESRSVKTREIIIFRKMIYEALTVNSHNSETVKPHCHVVFVLHRVVKCDVTKIKICDFMGFVKIIRQIKTKNVSLPKISMLVQIVGKILPQLCFNDSKQILLKMAWFLKLGTKPI